jgi:hypothetical protein
VQATPDELYSMLCLHRTSAVFAELDQAIQSQIEIACFFLDGRVEHGHDKLQPFPSYNSML